MRQPRRDPLLLSTPSLAAFIVVMHLVLAGCAAERAGIQKGDSGPIAWEVIDIRQSLEEQGNRMRWDYTLVLRNIGSTTVTFDQMTLITMVPGGNMSGGHSTRPYVLTLEPGGEVRDANNSYNHGCIRNCDPQYVRQMFRNGVTRVIELRGRDGAGQPVSPVIRLRLDSSMGTKPTPVSANIRPTPIHELGQIAGKWRGAIYGSGSALGTMTIERDGQYTWRGDREGIGGTLRTGDDGRVRFESSTGRRGTLTLHEGDGRRRLTIVYDGVDWKGELTPAE
jgi:hypothetical protein